MTNGLRWVAASVALTAACTQASPEQQIVEDAVAVIGGADQVAAVATLVIEGTGDLFSLGQNKTPTSELPRFEVTALTRAVDLAGGRWRQEHVMSPRYLTRNTATRTQILALDGDVAFNVGPDGRATRANDIVAEERRALLLHHPLGALQAALAPDSELANARAEGTEEAVDVLTADGERFTLWIDSEGRHPTRVQSMGYHGYLGDVVLETEFGDYAPAGDLTLPSGLTSKIDGTVVAEVRVTESRVGGDVGDLSAPADVRSGSVEAPAPTVTVEEVAAGIWLLAGQSHHSVAVEFEDHLTLIEAPQSDVRALAVIARARELSDKPLTHVVVTHHHFDHSGGVRAALSEGLTLIVHEASGDFYEELAARPQTRHRDALASSPKPAAVEHVSDETTLTDGTQTIVLYSVTENLHADTMLMAYAPDAGLLIEADLFTPPAPNATTPQAYPFVENLLENVHGRNLRVNRIVPIHGGIVPFADLVEVAASLEAPSQ